MEKEEVTFLIRKISFVSKNLFYLLLDLSHKMKAGYLMIRLTLRPIP